MFLDTGFLRDEEIVLRLHHTEPADPARNWVPTYQFEICRCADGAVMGVCDLRIGHNQQLYYGGNIGYRIEPPYRGHAYAAKACRLLFELARRHGMDRLIITCNPDNLASARTCEKAGGVLLEIVDLPPDNDMYLEGERQKRIYAFTL